MIQQSIAGRIGCKNKDSAGVFPRDYGGFWARNQRLTPLQEGILQNAALLRHVDGQNPSFWRHGAVESRCHRLMVFFSSFTYLIRKLNHPLLAWHAYYTLLTTPFLLHPSFYTHGTSPEPGEVPWRLIGSPSCKQPRSHKCFSYGPLISLDSVTSSTPSTTRSPVTTRQKVWRPRPKLQVCLTWWNHVGAFNVPYNSYLHQNTGISWC